MTMTVSTQPQLTSTSTGEGGNSIVLRWRSLRRNRG
jgi:hypothetical protein